MQRYKPEQHCKNKAGSKDLTKASCARCGLSSTFPFTHFSFQQQIQGLSCQSSILVSELCIFIKVMQTHTQLYFFQIRLTDSESFIKLNYHS